MLLKSTPINLFGFSLKSTSTVITECVWSHENPFKTIEKWKKIQLPFFLFKREAHICCCFIPIRLLRCSCWRFVLIREIRILAEHKLLTALNVYFDRLKAPVHLKWKPSKTSNPYIVTLYSHCKSYFLFCMYSSI